MNICIRIYYYLIKAYYKHSLLTISYSTHVMNDASITQLQTFIRYWLVLCAHENSAHLDINYYVNRLHCDFYFQLSNEVTPYYNVYSYLVCTIWNLNCWGTVQWLTNWTWYYSTMTCKGSKPLETIGFPIGKCRAEYLFHYM